MWSILLPSSRMGIRAEGLCPWPARCRVQAYAARTMAGTAAITIDSALSELHSPLLSDQLRVLSSREFDELRKRARNSDGLPQFACLFT